MSEVTLNDVQLASAYYPILVAQAKKKQTITYGKLVKAAKQHYPDLPHVQKAIATSCGRKLHSVRLFTNERGYPDLTSLVVNASKGQCGDNYTKHFDPDKVRAEVLAFDWSDVATDFEGFIEAATQAATPKKTRARHTAKRIMADYYKENKATLPPSIKTKRAELISLLMEGHPKEQAFEIALTT